MRRRATLRHPDHKAVLHALAVLTDPWRAVCFRAIEAETGLPRRQVRRIVRHLARSGLAVYRRGLWTDDMMPAGAGYGITIEGLHALMRLGMIDSETLRLKLVGR